jgi:hypothetical protein
MNDQELETRLRARYRARARETETAPAALRRDIAIIATDAPRSRLSRRGRGITLLAAATVLLVGGALAAGSALLRLPALVPPLPAPSPAAVLTAAPSAQPPSPSVLARPSANPIRAVRPGSWIATGSMITPRYGNIAVRLADGRVLVAGGEAKTGESLTSAEVYDPNTGTWSATGSMIHTTGAFPASLLSDGRVLVGDARNGDGNNGAELYDPASGTWASAASPSGGGNLSTTTLLRDGKVLGVAANGAQLYDPASDTWTATGTMVTPRYGTTATLLSDGRVLVAGGLVPVDKAIKSAELYDPQANAWTATTDVPNTDYAMSAALLRDGTVLFLPNNPRPRGPRSTAMLYDPATETWTATGDLARQDAHYDTLTELLDGTVLAAYGRGSGPMLAELYEPSTHSWSTTGSMLPDAEGNELSGRPVLLSDGTVLVAGGGTCTPNSPVSCPSGATGFAERYAPAGVSLPTGLVPVPSPTPTPTLAPLPTPFPPAAGPVPKGGRSWEVTVENKSSKPATLFLAQGPLNDMRQLCGSITPDVVPAHTTQKVTFEMPPKGQTECWLMVRPRPGADGAFGPTDGWPIPGPRKLIIGAPGENGPDSATLWVGP